MRPSTALEAKRDLVHEIVIRFRTTNPRVFGSVLYGKDAEDSGLDLLVDPLPGATLFLLSNRAFSRCLGEGGFHGLDISET